MVSSEETVVLLRQMAAVFERTEGRVDELSRAVIRIETEKANVESLRATSDEMRRHLERQNETQSTALEKYFTNLVAGVRSDVERNVHLQIRDALNNWMEESFKPILKAEIDRIEEARKVLRDTQIQRWRNRVLLLTAILTAVFTTWQMFQHRAEIDRLKDAKEVVRQVDRAGKLL